MKEIAIEFINILEEHNYKAYIVGGFVRDYLLGIESHDIDITTNATPKDIGNVFDNIKVKKNINLEDNYGSVQVIYKNIVFEVTTFREELEYFDNRHPSRIRYINDLEPDLKRRDFTINAICISKDGKIIDPLNGQEDLQKKIIKTIGDSKKSFQDDALRILRAIRFSVTLNFELDKEIIKAIKTCKKYLKNISYEKKKLELDKIFASNYAKRGIEILKQLSLIEVLDLENIDRVKDYSDVMGIWSMINPPSYHFTKIEREMIDKVNLVYEMNNLDPIVLYRYGLYVNILAGTNKDLSKKKITEYYNKLPIKSKNEIMITAPEICEILKKEPGPFLKEIYEKLEIEILKGKLNNVKEDILSYIVNNFKSL